jgi:hypothetical protein
LSEELRLKVFENRVLRIIFWPKGDEETSEWSKLRNEELNDMLSSPSIIRVIKSKRIRWTRHVPSMGERKGTHRVLEGKPEGKGQFGRPWSRWEDNIKMNLQEVGCGYVLDRAASG